MRNNKFFYLAISKREGQLGMKEIEWKICVLQTVECPYFSTPGLTRRGNMHPKNTCFQTNYKKYGFRTDKYR